MAQKEGVRVNTTTLRLDLRTGEVLIEMPSATSVGDAAKRFAEALGLASRPCHFFLALLDNTQPQECWEFLDEELPVAEYDGCVVSLWQHADGEDTHLGRIVLSLRCLPESP